MFRFPFELLVTLARVPEFVRIALSEIVELPVTEAFSELLREPEMRLRFCEINALLETFPFFIFVFPEPEMLSFSVPEIRVLVPELRIWLSLSEILSAEEIKSALAEITILLPDREAKFVTVWESVPFPAVIVPEPLMLEEIETLSPNRLRLLLLVRFPAPSREEWIVKSPLLLNSLFSEMLIVLKSALTLLSKVVLVFTKRLFWIIDMSSSSWMPTVIP